MTIVETLQRRGAYRGRLKEAVDDGTIFQVAEGEDGDVGDGAMLAKTESMLIDAKEAAGLCGVGRTTWLSLSSAGKTPASVRLGRRVLWRRDELKSWIAAGCPSREKWEVMKKR